MADLKIWCYKNIRTWRTPMEENQKIIIEELCNNGLEYFYDKVICNSNKNISCS